MDDLNLPKIIIFGLYLLFTPNVSEYQGRNNQILLGRGGESKNEQEIEDES